jgi:hypothetical protein
VATSASVESVSVAVGQVIADVGSGGFIVAIGSAQGIKVGDRLTVFAERVTRNKQGEVVYREEERIATLEVVDVSMADRARANLVSQSAVRPKEGDKVRVDATRAAEVRSAVAPTGAAEASSDVQRLIRQGDRYMEDKYFPQAIDAYQKALTLEPNSAVLLGKLASAFVSNRQPADAEDLADRLFAAGGQLSVEVAHEHAFGLCLGRINVSDKGIVYVPQNGDHGFDSVRTGIADVGFTEIRRPPHLLTNPWIRVLDERSKDKKYDFYALAYIQSPDPILLFRNPDAAEDTLRLHRMLTWFMQQRIRRK